MSAAIDDAAATERGPVLVDLALQGGGSHGAFTWGVLDRLLEEPWIKIEAISGTSAGAMNAAVLVDGWSRGGADDARARGPKDVAARHLLEHCRSDMLTRVDHGIPSQYRS